MTSKSDFSQRSKIKVTGQLSGMLLIGLCSLFCAASAQDKHPSDDGAQLPTPPSIKQRGGGEGDDQQFHPAPIDREGATGFNRRSGQGEAGGMEEGFRRRQRFQRQFDGDRSSGNMEGSQDGMPLQGRRSFGGEGMPQRPQFGGGRGGFRGERLGFGGMPGRQLDLTPLGLNEEQKTKIQQMREQSKNKVKELHKTLMTKQLEVRNLVFSADSTETDIRTARKGLLKIQEQIDETSFNDLLNIRKLLTAEQKKKLPECMPTNNLSRGGPQEQMPPGPGFKRQKPDFSQKPQSNEPASNFSTK